MSEDIEHIIDSLNDAYYKIAREYVYTWAEDKTFHLYKINEPDITRVCDGENIECVTKLHKIIEHKPDFEATVTRQEMCFKCTELIRKNPRKYKIDLVLSGLSGYVWKVMHCE
jgi:hypothetical protein